jgi:hypothetical protein
MVLYDAACAGSGGDGGLMTPFLWLIVDAVLIAVLVTLAMRSRRFAALYWASVGFTAAVAVMQIMRMG